MYFIPKYLRYSVGTEEICFSAKQRGARGADMDLAELSELCTDIGIVDAGKMMLSGSSFAAVLRDDKMEGVFYASDLIRYFMYLGTESMSDYASFLVPAPEYSNEDRRVYELRVPEAELANMDILPTALMLVAADKHLAQQGCLDCTLSSSSFFYPEQITQVGGLMLCTALTSNGKAGFSVEAEVYTETATFAKAMLIFTER